ncbi:kin of IRRE-like protein 3 [Saccostrea echinata]|uniref:kin of IRRE-like protein 3 n=1 Tax=Saccostrea echinata TaxID=191078 RepID=UPI002A803F79|nr:kin of IRRE-like protein 3 [Saccostrea echinata]
MKDVQKRWYRRGSDSIVSNKTTLFFKSVSYADTGSYICVIKYQSCDTNTTQNGRKNLTKTVHLDVQGAPLLILPDRRKSFHVAEGQSILFNITIASSPPPLQSLTIVESNNRNQLQFDVEFNRTVMSFSDDIAISKDVPVYTAYIRLNNITSTWTGEYILCINNSYGYATYEFSIKVFRPNKVSVWQSRAVEIVGGGIGGFIFLFLVVGIIYMCQTRYKQKALQEKIKEFVEAERKGSMESLEVLGLGKTTKGFDNFTTEEEHDHFRQLQSLNTFNNPEEN